VTNSGWSARAYEPARPQAIEIRMRERLCTLRKDQIDLEKRLQAHHGA
jgi:hypothetical protein